MPGSITTQDDQVAFVRRLFTFGIVAESLPLAIEETLGLSRSDSMNLVKKALTEDDLAVIFPKSDQ